MTTAAPEHPPLVVPVAIQTTITPQPNGGRQVSKIKDPTVKEEEVICSGGGFRTPTRSVSKSLDRNAIVDDLNARTASTTNPLPTDPVLPPATPAGFEPTGVAPLEPAKPGAALLPPGYALVAHEAAVRSAAGAAPLSEPSDVPIGSFRTSQLLRAVSDIAMHPETFRGSARLQELAGELRARAWSLEREAERTLPCEPGQCGCAHAAVLREIGEVRS